MSGNVVGCVVGGLLLALTPVVAAGGAWTEIGDAPDWPAAASWQATQGVGPLTSISGLTSLQVGDIVDAYGIRITDVASFYATTSALTDAGASANFDTRLWLFFVDGTPVLGNDDAPGDTDFHSLLTDPQSYPGTVAATASGIALNPGQYVLIISGYINDPEDSQNLDMVGPFLTGGFEHLHGPNPGAGPFDHWENMGADETGAYTIALSGATFNVPTPGVGMLVAIGISGMFARRRRRHG